jgi:hypothetical protein
MPVLSHRASLWLKPLRTTGENHEWRGETRNSPDESDASAIPHDWRLSHIDAPQRTWPCYPVPSVARSTGVPRDSPAVDCRFRWGARYVRLLGTVRTLYTNTRCLSSPGYRRLRGREEARAASRSSGEWRALLIDGAESGAVCLLSQPSLTRTVRRFTCLPTGSRLARVEVASWCPGASRGRYAGMRCHGGGKRTRRGSYAGNFGRRRRSRGPAPRFRGGAKPKPVLARHAPWKGSVGLLHV